MNDNVIEFGKKPAEKRDEPPQGPSADEILRDAIGKYQGVVLIGVNKERAQCLSTLSLDEAVYEVSRALHRLHCFIDRA